MNPLTPKRAKKRLNEHGQAAIEFAAIIPVLFIFFYAVLEFSVLFIQQQRVSSLSREAANAAFRDCSSQEVGDPLDACLANVAAQVNDQANNILSGFGTRGTVIVSAYAPDPAALEFPPPVIRLALERGGIEQETHYEADDLNREFVFTQGILVISEIFYTYMPLASFTQLLGIDVFPAVLYENTIY